MNRRLLVVIVICLGALCLLPAVGAATPGEGTPAGLETVLFEVETEEEDEPAIAGFSDEPLHLGEVDAGETNFGTTTVVEMGGAEGLDGVIWNVVADDPNGDLDFDGMGDVQTTPGGSDTVDWTVSADEDAPNQLSWTVEVFDSRYPDESRQVDVEVDVHHPGQFGDPSIGEELELDEPRATTDEVTRTLNLSVSNVGHEDVPLESATLSTPEPGIDLTVSDVPDEIPAQMEVDIEVEATADTSLEEASYPVDGVVSSSDPDIEDAEIQDLLPLVHGIEFDIDEQVHLIGDLEIGESIHRSTDVTERLGYHDPAAVDVGIYSGEEEWIDLEETPTELSTGTDETIGFGVEFGPDAEHGTEYEWLISVEAADSIEREMIEVTATPIPLDFEDIQASIELYDQPAAEYHHVAASGLTLIDSADEQMRAGDVTEGDISATLAFSDATTIYLESISDGLADIDDENHQQAQTNISRAAAAYHSLSIYHDEFEDGILATEAESVLAEADVVLEGAIDDQEVFYEDWRGEDDVTLLEEAIIERELAQIASLRGEDTEAEQREAEADEAFEEYADTVADAEQAYQDGEDSWETLEDELLFTIGGQPLMLNPMEFDEFTDQRSAMESSYEEAIASLEEAGESSREEFIAEQYDQRSSDAQIAQWSLIASIAVYGLFAVGIIVRTGRGTYRYVQDARESVTGDFLV